MVTKLTEAQFKAAELLDGAANGDIESQIRFFEGISTSDIPVQLSPTLTKLALSTYAEQPTIWRSFATKETLPDFGKQEYYAFTGWGDEDVERSTAGDTFIAGGLPTVPEYGEYARLRFEAMSEELRLKKGGVAVQFSWETLRSTRNIGLIQRAFTEFGKRAAVKEDHEATKQLTAKNFNAGNNNLAVGDAAGPLQSIEQIQAMFQQIENQTDIKGNPVIPATSYVLVCGMSTAMRARELQSITQIERVTDDGAGNVTRTIAGNPVSTSFQVVENPYFQALGIDPNAWFLLPAPGAAPNPSVMNAFLQGYEAPQIFVKRTTNSAPEEGAFIDDSYETKVRHVVTGQFLRPEGTLAYLGE